MHELCSGVVGVRGSPHRNGSGSSSPGPLGFVMTGETWCANWQETIGNPGQTATDWIVGLLIAVLFVRMVIAWLGSS